MTMPELHPELAELAGLLGTWRGRGRGDYPTIEPFEYLEEVTFAHVGKPFLAYVQKTRRLVDGEPGEPLHAEAGYLRPAGPGAAELVIAQPTGIVEVHTGPIDGGVIDLRAQTVGLTPTAKRVHAVRRRLSLDGHTLTYDLWMGHADTPETHHLTATLERHARPDDPGAEVAAEN